MLSAAAAAALSSGLVTLLLHVSQASDTPQAAQSACVLMLVPGVTLINAVEDAIKGHAVVALGRATDAGLVIVFAAMGLLLSAAVMGALLS